MRGSSAAQRSPAGSLSRGYGSGLACQQSALTAQFTADDPLTRWPSSVGLLGFAFEAEAAGGGTGRAIFQGADWDGKPGDISRRAAFGRVQVEIHGVWSVGGAFDARLGENWTLGAGATFSDSLNARARSSDAAVQLGYRWLQ